MSFRLIPNSVTLNGVMKLTLRYFTEFSSFWAHYVEVVEDTQTLSATER